MAAASFPTLDQMTEATESDHHPMVTSDVVDTFREAPAAYQFASGQNPQGGVDLPQFYGSSLTWLNTFRAHADASTRHFEPDGALHEGYEYMQRTPGVELNFGISEDTAGRDEHQQNSGGTNSLDNVQQRAILIFPAGEVDDPVTITASDLEGLQPMRYLSNNIIDFYIKYLERTQVSSEDRERFYFFNSFFFTKLLGNSSAFTDIDQCEVDYDQVRKWTGEVNLFEKDYIFIPILRSSHWSVVIICHLSSLTSSPDKRKGSPCVFHLDPVEGKHESFEGQVRSYIIQAWMQSYRDSNDRDRVILALACRMKYIRAKVPQQGNGYDCGLYLLHYVEVFIRESSSPHFSFASSNGGPHFTSPHFAGEVSAKRVVIQNLIFELRNNPQERLAATSMGIQPKPQRRASNGPSRNAQPKHLLKPPKGQIRISKKWNEKETSVLLERMVEGGRIRKGTEGATHWDRISQDIQTKLGTIRTGDECRRRYDTLLKAYKKIKKTGKPFCDITDTERVELNLATPLSEEWYKSIDKMDLQRRNSANAKSRKRAKPNPSDDNGMLSSSARNPPPPPIPSGYADQAVKPSRKQVAIPGFSTLSEDLRSTLLNLIQSFSMKSSFSWRDGLEEVCQRLGIVQDREPSEIRKFIFQLSELKLVNLGFDDEYEVPGLKVSDLRMYKKFVEKALLKNTDFNIYHEMCSILYISFPEAPLSRSLQRIRVLILYKCIKLEHADLSHFPELRFLELFECGELKAVTGWEVLKKVGWLKICRCDSYLNFPPVQCLPSLMEFGFIRLKLRALEMNWVPDFSQCVRLRRLKIKNIKSSALSSMDFRKLRFLEVLTLGFCPALTTIQGLSGLHSLTKLDLSWCSALRRVPELGCLKALTHLDMSFSGVEEIPGVQELHLLTELTLEDCESLETLPCLGHLKALTGIDIGWSGVEEIPGVRDLVSLEDLYCEGPRLKWLPDLHHLPRLRRVRVGNTPLSTTDPSSFYYQKIIVHFNSKEDSVGFVDEISEISDTEYNHSDDDSH